MNLADALAYVAAMSPAEKAAWDQTNRFTTDADRDLRALWAYELLEPVTLPHHVDVTDDVLINLANTAHGAALELTDILTLLRIWPGPADANFPPEPWLDPA